MKTQVLRRAALGAVLAVAVVMPVLARAQPSTVLDDYAILADTKFKSKGLTLGCGHVGVNQEGGYLRAPRFLSAPGQVVADVVKLGELATYGELFANIVVKENHPATSWTPPLFTDLATECAFPDPFPVCDLGSTLTIDAGTTQALGPGVYGDIRVKGGIDPITLLPNPGILELGGGSYTFCNIKLSKHAEVQFTSPATVNVVGNLKMQRSNVWGGIAPSDIILFVRGKVHYSRGAQVAATLCAPASKCRLTKGGSHAGRVYCNFVRTEEIFFDCGSPSGAFLD